MQLLRGTAGVIVLTSLWVAACASAGGTAKPEPFPRVSKPAPGPPVACAGVEPGCGSTPLSEGPNLVHAALELRGTPYAPGGSGPDSFDCSGFVKYVFAKFGIGLPRTVTSQFDATVEVPFEQLAPGDLIFFRTEGNGPSHVAIAVGDGTFIHAPSSRGVVRVESLASSYWRERFDSVRRVR